MLTALAVLAGLGVLGGVFFFSKKNKAPASSNSTGSGSGPSGVSPRDQKPT